MTDGDRTQHNHRGHSAAVSARGPDRSREVAPVRPGEDLDWPRLEVYLREQIDELDGEFEVLQFPNGSANLTYLVRFGDQSLVVRRPPFGVLAPGAHDMRREFRAIDALSRHFSPVPKPYLFCDDHDVIGSNFIVVEYRRGVVVWDTIPESMAHHLDIGRRIGTAVVDALAKLHLLDPSSIGLGEFGRPTGFIERQIAGWRKRWDLVDTGRVPEMAVVGERLETSLFTIPAAPTASVLHNDYKVDNCQFDPAQPDRVHSIFDWDMATLGDPLVDLGTLLNYWPDSNDHDDDRPLHVPGLERIGLIGRDEVISRYAECTEYDVSGISWYIAFATWKTAVILEQLYQRYVRGESTDPRMAERGEPVARLAARSGRLLDEQSAP